MPAAPLPLPGQTPVPSPCVSVCRMDPHDRYCEGCLRTLDEIAVWAELDDGGKRLVWLLIAERRRRAA